MGNYSDHVRYGHLAYAILCIALVGAVLSGGLTLFVGIPLAVVAYPFVRVGASFPDVDHHASHPHRRLRRAMFIVGTITSFFVLYTQTLVPLDVFVTGIAVDLPVETKVAVLIHLSSLLIGVVMREAVSYFRPKHRGITHRIPTGLVIAGVIGGISWYLTTTIAVAMPVVISAVTAGAFFIGFLSHLRCDEMIVPAIQWSWRTIIQTVTRIRQASPL